MTGRAQDTTVPAARDRAAAAWVRQAAPCHLRVRDRGAVATELAVLAPALVLVLLFVVFAGRLGQAQQDVTQATAEGARVAALERGGDVTTLARRTVAANLAAAGVACAALRVNVTGIPPQPGAAVTVTTRCEVDMTGVAALGLPRHRAVHGRATEVVDTYRGDG